MAEYLLGKYFPEQYCASSAGVEASDYADPFTISVMRSEEDINLINFEPRALHDIEDLGEYGTLIALSEGAYTHIKQDKSKHNHPYNIEFWDTPAPPDRNQQRDIIIEGYKDLLSTIKGHIENRFTAAE